MSASPRNVIPREHKMAIAILVLAAFVVILNETILAVALTHLMDDLRINESTVQWVSTAFLLTMAVTIPTTGYLLERSSTRVLFLTALVVFTLGTIACAVAPGIVVLLIGRIIQALGTAIMLPLLMTTILQLVNPNQRGQIMGVVMIVISVAPALGPTVSGLVLQFLPWRWIFWIVVPIAIAATAFGAWKLPNVSEPSSAKLDLVSIPLTVVGFGGLVYGLNALSEGAGSALLWISLALGALALALFVWRQLVLQGRNSPLLDLRALTHRPFRLGLGMIMIAMAALIGVATLWPIYLQRVHQISSITTGLLLLPGGLAIGLFGPVIGRMYDRWGAKVLALPASTTLLMAIFAMSRVHANTPQWVLLGLHVLMSVSLAFIFTPLFADSLNSLPPKLYAHGSAMLSALQQVAGAAGTALLVAIMAIARTRAEATGATAADSTLAGIQLALLVASGIIVGAVVLAAVSPFGPPKMVEE